MHDERHVISLRKPVTPQEPPRTPEQLEVPKKQGSLRKYLYIVLGLGVVATIGAGVWKFQLFQKNLVSSTPDSQASAAQQNKEAADLVAQVGKLIQLPQGEVPTIATVSDPANLIDQDFFKQAKIGDKVLIYIEAKKAYLYRPSAHLLIEVAPITPEAQ